MQAKITNGTSTLSTMTMPGLGIMRMDPTTWMIDITTRMRVRAFRMV